MNNTNSTNHSKQLRTWGKIVNDCKVAKASGTVNPQSPVPYRLNSIMR